MGHLLIDEDLIEMMEKCIILRDVDLARAMLSRMSAIPCVVERSLKDRVATVWKQLDQLACNGSPPDPILDQLPCIAAVDPNDLPTVLRVCLLAGWDGTSPLSDFLRSRLSS